MRITAVKRKIITLIWREMGDCENFLNQAAIDAVIREHNKDLGEQLYIEGHNCCHECADSPISISAALDTTKAFFALHGAKEFHRICYKPRYEIRVIDGKYGVWDNRKGRWVFAVSGMVLTRDTLPSAQRLLEDIKLERSHR